MNPVKKSLMWGRHQLTLETGEIARQASGAVMVTMEDTVVLVTVVGARNAKPGQDFFPLTVDYQERTYAAGKIPGGFFRREGRPSEKEILTCRLIDRPIRPLFPEGYNSEVQIVATVMSSNNEIDSDIPAMVGASAALDVALQRGEKFFVELVQTVSSSNRRRNFSVDSARIARVDARAREQRNRRNPRRKVAFMAAAYKKISRTDGAE